MPRPFVYAVLIVFLTGVGALPFFFKYTSYPLLLLAGYCACFSSALFFIAQTESRVVHRLLSSRVVLLGLDLSTPVEPARAGSRPGRGPLLRPLVKRPKPGN